MRVARCYQAVFERAATNKWESIALPLFTLSHRTTFPTQTSILKRVPNEAVQIILYNPSDKNALNDAREIGIAILLSSQIDNKKESSLCNLTTNFERKHKKTLSIVDIQLADYKKRPDAPFYKEVANGAVIWSK